MKRALVYVRLSLDKKKGQGKDAGEGLGLDRQEAECRALVRKHRGVRVVTVLHDHSISAYSGKVRPGYQELLRRIRDDEADIVVVWHPDRLHRSPKELEEYIEACEPRNVPTLTVTAGAWDLSTPAGRMQARTIGAFARYESEQKRDRIRAEQRQAGQAGKRHGGGMRPFGYSRTKVPNSRSAYTKHPIEAPALADAVSRVLAGESMGSVITEWNRSGLRTVSGKMWNYTLFRSVLVRPTNGGIVHYEDADGKQQEARGNWEPIVEPDQQRALLKMLADPSRRSSRNWEPRHLSSGIAMCGRCGSPLRRAMVKLNGSCRGIYRCSGLTSKSTQCGTSITSTILDGVLRAAVVEAYIRGTATEPPGVSSMAGIIVELRGQLAGVVERKEQLLRLLRAGAFTEGEVIGESRELNTQRASIEAKLQRAIAENAHDAMVEEVRTALDSYRPTRIEGLPDEERFFGPVFEEAGAHRRAVVGQRFDELSLTQRRVLARAYCKVTVRPGGRGASRITIEPTNGAPRNRRAHPELL